MVLRSFSSLPSPPGEKEKLRPLLVLRIKSGKSSRSKFRDGGERESPLRLSRRINEKADGERVWVREDVTHTRPKIILKVAAGLRSTLEA